MIRLVKILAVLIIYFVLQSIFQIVLMSMLARFGISYMDVNVKGETFKEVIETISVYLFYSKLFYIASAYFVFSIASTLFFYQNKEISFKNIATIHIAVNMIIFLVLWFGFGNGITFIANPFLGLLLAGLLIYFLASKFRKPLIRQKVVLS